MRGRAQRRDGLQRVITGRPLRALLAAGCSALAMFQFVAAASAKTVQFDSSFTCTTEAPCGTATSWTPTYAAVNEATGDVYLVDSANDAIDVFDAAGKYLSRIPGSSTTAGSFKFGAIDDIAVDNSGGPNDGRIYVDSESAGLVFAFDPAGKFLWQSSAGIADVCGIAVDPSGNPWIGDYFNGVQELGTEKGEAVGSPILQNTASCNIAFDSRGDIALLHYGGGITVYDQAQTPIHEDNTGLTVNDVGTFTGPSPVYTDSIFAVDSSGVTIWDSSGNQIPETPFGPRNAALSVAVNAANSMIYVTEPGAGKVEIYTLIPHYTLGVSPSGPGIGLVTCDGTYCAPNYANNEPVILEALSAEGSTFAGWTVNGSTSACAGTGPCELTLSANTTVEARFVLEEHELSVSENGVGEVQSNPPGIACGTACKAMIAGDELVVLSAIPGPHNHLARWSGCDSVTAGECEVAVSSDRSVSAEFAPTMRRLVMDLAGTGSGTVACQVGVGPQEPCAAKYLDGTIVTVTGTAASGSTFAGFSGAGCSGTGPCVLTLSGDTSLTARFDAVAIESRVEPPAAAKPAAPPTSRPVPPTEAPKVKKKRLTRSQLLAAAIKKCRALPKHRRAACVKRAKHKYGQAKHGKRSRG